MRLENDPLSSVERSAGDARKSGNVTHLQVSPQRMPSAVSEYMRPHERATHPEHPLEQLCVHCSEPFQLKFARHAQRLFDESADLELVASHHGLTIRGENEESIAAALRVLRNFYGRQIRTEPLRVRYHQGATLEQPWMVLRVRCPADRVEAVKADLTLRGATILSSVLHRDMGGIQACGPLACLLGYGSALAEMTAGAGQCVMRLSHYAPVGRVPPDGDAA